MRVLKKTSFGLMAIILVVLAVGTILQKIDSSAVAAYTSPWFVALWTVMAVSAVAYMLRSRLYRRLPAFAVHASFAVILAGGADIVAHKRARHAAPEEWCGGKRVYARRRLCCENAVQP